MILESLFELVETLKVRIDAHGDQLRQSEALYPLRSNQSAAERTGVGHRRSGVGNTRV